MSRRGRNNEKRVMIDESRNTVIPGRTEPETKVATNNSNPLFHYLQTMFPNYDNAVLHAVLEQEGNSIERAIEVLLSFADQSGAGTASGGASNDDDGEIKFFDDFSDTEGMPHMATPIVSGIAAVDVVPGVSGFNSSRDHVSLYEYQKRRRSKKSQRARRRKQAYLQQKVYAAQQVDQQQKRVRWVPLQDFLTDADDANPFVVLQQIQELEKQQQHEEEAVSNEDDECKALLSEDEIEESWKQFEEAVVDEEEEAATESELDCIKGDFDWTAVDTALAALAPAAPESWESRVDVCETSSSSGSESDDFFVIEKLVEQPVADAVPEAVPAQPRREQQVVVKMYYSSSDIHRLGLGRSALTFDKLFEHAANYLGGKCQSLPRASLPRAFALTYVDEEGDTITLCSEEELAEALRVHEENFWTDGKQPLIRIHVKPIDAATHEGHVLVALV